MTHLNARTGVNHHEAMAPVFAAEVEALRRELRLKNEEIHRLKLHIRRSNSGQDKRNNSRS
jgi:hypothetical protein